MDFSFLNSIKPSLIIAFHINKYNCLKPGSSFGKRIVNDYELEYIIWGEGYMITDGKWMPAQKGYVYFRRPGTVTEGFNSYHCYYLVFNMFGDGVDGVDECECGMRHRFSSETDYFPKSIKFSNTAQIEELFCNIFNQYVAGTPITEFIIRTNILQILLELYNEWLARERFSVKGKRIKDNFQNIQSLADYIKNNISHSFSLYELAELSGYSRYTLCRLFKDIMGHTIFEYINNYKIVMAKNLLLSTNKSIKEIILECGFENESYFYKLFKKNTNSSPLEFRRKSVPWLFNILNE